LDRHVHGHIDFQSDDHCDGNAESVSDTHSIVHPDWNTDQHAHDNNHTDHHAWLHGLLSVRWLIFCLWPSSEWPVWLGVGRPTMRLSLSGTMWWRWILRHNNANANADPDPNSYSYINAVEHFDRDPNGDRYGDCDSNSHRHSNEHPDGDTYCYRNRNLHHHPDGHADKHGDADAITIRHSNSNVPSVGSKSWGSESRWHSLCFGTACVDRCQVDPQCPWFRFERAFIAGMCTKSTGVDRSGEGAFG